MLSNTRQRTIKSSPARFTVIAFAFLMSVNLSVFAVNPYKSDVAIWGAMQVLDQPAIAIAAGGYYTVALRQNGTVVAWGNNDYGQTTVPGGLDSVIAISTEAGGIHTVALIQRGTTAVRNRDIVKVYKKFSLCYKAGNIFFSNPLPAGTMFTLFDLNGRVIFRTDVHGTSLKLPLRPALRIALWRVEHPKLFSSGRVFLR